MREPVLVLDGVWERQVEDAEGSGWETMVVPGTWEAQGVPKSYTGAVRLRRRFQWEPRGPRVRAWLRFGAVSYVCRVWLNGQCLGSHRGSWDAFVLEVTDALVHGENELVVRVEKPGGRYPLEESLAGFLPFVQGVMFGGIWQSVVLEATGPMGIAGVVAQPDLVRRRLQVSLTTMGTAERGAAVRLSLEDPGGVVVAEADLAMTPGSSFVSGSLAVPAMRLWRLRDPALYRLRCVLWVDGAVSDVWFQRLGMREVSVVGSRIFLNGEFVYPRGLLHWGWYPELLAPHSSREQTEREIRDMQSLGYNMIKHCLYVPPPDYLEAADELGMLTWLELPLWWPRVTEGSAEQMRVEYRRIGEQVRRHPSLILYTLGCELDERMPAALLDELYGIVKDVSRSPLVSDNSGSAECYGGKEASADFYDHHFYAEPHLYRQLLDGFSARARGPKPWLFGEFCDCDTYRDLEAVAAQGEAAAWWLVNDPDLNPQGVRWEYSVVDHAHRERSQGLLPYKEQLIRGSYAQAQVMRKYVLETVRSYAETSGYVVLNLRDAPLNTPGMYDDLGGLKFATEAFRQFNGDSVLALGWDRRRVWEAGGDRPYYLDRYNYWSGAPVRVRLQLAYGGAEAVEDLDMGWRVVDRNGDLVVEKNERWFGELPPGLVREVGIAEFMMPEVDEAQWVRLEVKVRKQGEKNERGREEKTKELIARNSWRLWVYPEVQPYDGKVLLWDPGYHRVDVEGYFRQVRRVTAGELELEVGEASDLVVASAWTEELRDWVQRGGRVLLWLSHGDPELTRAVPFWRESLKVFGDHPVWEGLPNEGYADLQFFGLASDRALDTKRLGKDLTGADEELVLRRVDARHLKVLDYVQAWKAGSGKLLVSTLRLEGGMGEQPSGLKEHVAGMSLLGGMMRWLMG